MDLQWIRWRHEFGDGLHFLSPAVSGEVSPEAFIDNVFDLLPKAFSNFRVRASTRAISPFIARLHLLTRRRLCVRRQARCIVLRACKRLSAQKDVFT